MDAVGLVHGSRHAIPPWSDQGIHLAKCWVVNEALAVYVLENVWHLLPYKWQ